MATNAEHSWPKTEIGGWDLFPSEVNGDLCPVGVILGWAKSLSGVTPSLPGNWLECDGSVISDSDSPMDGQTLPNLNGTTDATKRFLRGAATSGGTGGATTQNASHKHKWDTNWRGCKPGATNMITSVSMSNTIITAAVIPPSYEVVFVMRIK